MRRTNRLAAALFTVAIVAAAAPWSRSEEKAPAAAESGYMGMGQGRGMGMGKMGMMHGHMMGMGPMMMGGCPMMGSNVAVKVDKTKNGATLSFTSDDPKVVRRIQIHAEIMRLMHELQTEGGSPESE